jgi:glutathione S-transferase
LADRFPEKGFAPAPNSAARGAYYQWLLFATATLEPSIGTIFTNTVRQPENKELQATKDAQTTFSQSAQLLEDALKTGPFILGETISTADVILGAMLAWARALKLLENYPNILAYVARLSARPAFQAARKD